MYMCINKKENEHIPDLNWREIGLMVPFVIVIIWLGIYPAPVLRRMEPSAHKFVTSVQQGAQAASTVTSPIVAAAGAQR